MQINIMNNEQSVKIYNMVATSREWKMDRRKGREGREGTGIKEGEGEDVEQQGGGNGREETGIKEGDEGMGGTSGQAGRKGTGGGKAKENGGV